jgi:hypothetical protein
MGPTNASAGDARPPKRPTRSPARRMGPKGDRASQKQPKTEPQRAPLFSCKYHVEVRQFLVGERHFAADTQVHWLRAL